MEKTDKPWGHEELLVKTESYAMKKITIDPGHRMSLQYHENKEETIYVISGCLIVWKSEEFLDHITIQPGDVYHVKPKQVHRFGSPDDTNTVVIECSTTELEDVVRLADDYSRN
jgi:mannose-6-phosphate isomerase